MIWNIHGGNVLLVSHFKNFTKYKKVVNIVYIYIYIYIAVTSNIDFSIVVGSRCTSMMVGCSLSHPSSIYGWVNSDSNERCVLQLSTQKKIIRRKGQGQIKLFIIKLL